MLPTVVANVFHIRESHQYLFDLERAFVRFREGSVPVEGEGGRERITGHVPHEAEFASGGEGKDRGKDDDRDARRDELVFQSHGQQVLIALIQPAEFFCSVVGRVPGTPLDLARQVR